LSAEYWKEAPPISRSPTGRTAEAGSVRCAQQFGSALKALRLKPGYADARENLKSDEQAAITLPKTRRQKRTFTLR
jgi:hypothetical protein